MRLLIERHLGSLLCGCGNMRLTEVRPIFSCLAISDLLIPARYICSTRGECTAAVAGRPNRLPFLQRCGQMVTERPQRSKRQTTTTSISRRRAASINGSRAWRLAAPEPTSRDLHGYGPVAAGSIFEQHPDLHREDLLIIRGNACVQASPKYFRLSA